MKKVFIALLVVAAAGTAYFLYTRKTTTTGTVAVNKELLTGKWKSANTIPVADTTTPLYQYEFRQDGLLLRTVSDTAKADTMHYTWDKSNALVWKQQATDTAGTVYNVVQLTSDSLALKAASPVTELSLTRVK
ncbi:MAG: hypothetical protein NTW29_08490 [Bacteroidetes bacterium]|nr:hypothetical protein [Bacteroidota bacterium]